MAGESGKVTMVLGQEGDRVLVELPMVGFPPGFKLRKGERVVVVEDEAGPAVRPLVRATVSSADVAETAAFELAGTRYETQEATIRTESPSGTEAEGEEYVVWTVDRGESDAAGQVIAIRPR